jgi:hypothetical protein
VPPIFILFQAEPQFQPAWGNSEFWGRVRVSDGLVVLIQDVVRYHQPLMLGFFKPSLLSSLTLLFIV